MVNYGWVGLLMTRALNKRIARKVAAGVQNARADGRKVILVGHSNGCAIAHLAGTLYGAQIDLAVYINPALDEHLDPPESFAKVQVWHSPSDTPVRMAEWLLWSKARPWGMMGAVGYTGKSVKVQNINKQTLFPVVSNAHSDLFDVERVGYFGPVVATVAALGIGLVSGNKAQQAVH